MDINVQAIAEPEALRGMVMIVFNDVATTPVKRAASRSKTALSGETISTEVEEELQRVRAELQATREEMQTSREEQISANEELQSTNEELQSTNEELTTSREEMQSLNEELQTMNAEQQPKMEELSRVHTDMRNLLNSMEIVTIFLDNDLPLCRFTPGADKLFKLIPSDIGRPLSDIVSNLRYPELSEDERMVLQTPVFSEKQVPATDGSWFTVRIMPYRTMEDVTAGLVLTFTNITAAKELKAELRTENAELKKLLESKK